MKRKRIIIFIVVGLLGIILLASMISQGDTEVSADGEDYDTSFYVEGNGNIFIKTAKLLDKCCFYVVDVVISGIGSVFNSLLNN